MELISEGGPFPWTVKELKDYAKDNCLAEIMFDIAFLQGTQCRDKEAWLEALKGTAEDIIEKLREAQK